jgi:exodeoxyribonuclease VIII
MIDKIKNFYMVDIETLGRICAPIIQIGAVYVEDLEIVDTLSANIDWDDLNNYNFKYDPDTIKWWLNQDKDAINSVINSEVEYKLKDALFKLELFLNSTTDVIFNHSTFDAPNINNAFIETCNYNPIQYRRWKDLRSMDLFLPKIKLIRTGVHHSAADDAVYQSEYLIKQLKEYDKRFKKMY